MSQQRPIPPRPYHPCRTCTSKAPDTGVSAQLVEQFDEGQGVGVVEQRADFGHVLSPELFCFLAVVSRDEANEAPMRPVGAATLLLLILPAHQHRRRVARGVLRPSFGVRGHW